MLDTWTLQVLVEVGERGSFSAAAEALVMTQPAVSRQIGGLERRMGVRLFQRVPRGVRATFAGEVAIELAQDTLERLQAMESRLRGFTELKAGHLRLSAFPSANTFFVPEAVRRFSNAYPGVTLTLLQVDPSGPLRAVRDGRVDLALVTDWDLDADLETANGASDPSSLAMQAVDGVELITLLDEELRVALPSDHRLARHTRVGLRDLRDEVWIEGAHPDCLGPITPLADALGDPPRVGFTCDDWNGKQALVAAGAGVMLIPTLAQAAVRRDIVLRPTTPSLPTRRLYAAAAGVSRRSPAVTAMLSLLTAIAAQQQS